MNCCRETTKMGVPQLVPRYRGIGSEAYLNGTSQEPTPEDARKDGHIRGRSKACNIQAKEIPWIFGRKSGKHPMGCGSFHQQKTLP